MFMLAEDDSPYAWRNPETGQEFLTLAARACVVLPRVFDVFLFLNTTTRLLLMRHGQGVLNLHFFCFNLIISFYISRLRIAKTNDVL